MQNILYTMHAYASRVHIFVKVHNKPRKWKLRGIAAKTSFRQEFGRAVKNQIRAWKGG